jgi:hypothetical protein
MEGELEVNFLPKRLELLFNNILKVGLCPVCNEYRHDLHHNGTVNHRFHFAKWQYNEFSKPLSNNRHGIVLDAQAEQVNNFRFIFKYIGGKYTVKVT